MQRMALFVHTGKARALAVAQEVAPLLRQAGIEVVTDATTAQALPNLGQLATVAELAQADAALVLGGDGMLLQAARDLAGAGVPILGVNLGHLGFLTEVEPNELVWALPQLLRGDFHIEERMMADVVVCRTGVPVAEYRVLNDAVISRGTFARLVTLEALVDDSTLGVFVGDGLILATPTGSTAYSLSAGGPIVHPGVDGILVTPICPHTLGERSVLTRGEDTVRVLVKSPVEPDELVLTVDGRPGLRLVSGDEVRVSRSRVRVRLIRLAQRTFYDVLAMRLHSADC